MNLSAVKIVDAHCHLQADELKPHLPGIIDLARQHKVVKAVCNGTSETDWMEVQELAGRYPLIHPAFGLHPLYIQARTSAWFEKLDALISGSSAGIGEIGMDNMKASSALEQQAYLFRRQLTLALKYERPVSIHCLKCWGALIQVLTETAPLPPFMIHAFGGSTETLRVILKLGGYVSFAGSTLISGHKTAQEAFLQVPLDRLLIESDAPDLNAGAAYQHRILSGAESKELSEPANLDLVLAGLAGIRKIETAELAAHALENSCKFFGLTLPP